MFDVVKSRRWELVAYWLLYVVASAAVLWHWKHGNPLLSMLCLAAVVMSVRFITRPTQRGDQG